MKTCSSIITTFLLVYYCGDNNRVDNLTDGIFTIFKNTNVEEPPQEGYYFAKLVRETQDKSGNKMYIVDLLKRIPSFCIPHNVMSFFENYDNDNTVFYNALCLVTSKIFFVDKTFMRVLYAIISGTFAQSEFTKDDVKKLYDIIVSGRAISSYIKDRLTAVFRKIQKIVAENPKKYFMQLMDAIKTPQPVTGVSFIINDINGDLKEYIPVISFPRYSIPVLYSNKEEETLILRAITENIELCNNYNIKVVTYKGKEFVKFFTNSKKMCG